MIIIVIRSASDSDKEKKSGQLFFPYNQFIPFLNFASKRFEENVDIDNQRWEIYVSL